MNNKRTTEILQDARESLRPTLKDRERLHRRVMGAVGAAAIVSATGASAASNAGAAAGGAAATTGISAGTIAVIKLGTAGVFLAGVIALGVWQNEKALKGDALNEKAPLSQQMQPVDRPTLPEENTMNAVASPSVEPAATESQISELTVTSSDTGNSNPDESAVAASPQHPNASPTKHRRNRGARRAINAAEDDTFLLGEIQLLRKATRALSSNSFSSAVRLLRQYNNTYPNGQMRQERDGLFIQALCGAGRIEDAAHADAVFRKRYGKKPILYKVNAACTVEGESNENE